MKLSNFTQGRDNNFNIIRIIAALAVLVTHSYLMVIGKAEAEPLLDKLGMTIGAVAVDLFFVTSGFLVAASLLYRQSVIEFIWARTLRIYPALLVMLLLTVFGMGLYFTTLPPSAYLTNSKTYLYFGRCAFLFVGIAHDLPGVFETNPYSKLVNGSLWTLSYEVRMYLLLVVAWIGSGLVTRSKTTLFKAVLILIAVATGVLSLAQHFHPGVANPNIKLYYMFFTGASFYVLKEHIKIWHSLVGILAVLLVSSVFISKDAFYVMHVLTTAYILFYIAYVPGGLIRKYNQLGDYSYGVYIYAFPVQQSLIALIPGLSILSMLLISTVITLALAVLSWHLLEKRALGLKGMSVDHTRKILSYSLSRGAIET